MEVGICLQGCVRHVWHKQTWPSLLILSVRKLRVPRNTRPHDWLIAITIITLPNCSPGHESHYKSCVVFLKLGSFFSHLSLSLSSFHTLRFCLSRGFEHNPQSGSLIRARSLTWQYSLLFDSLFSFGDIHSVEFCKPMKPV